MAHLTHGLAIVIWETAPHLWITIVTTRLARPSGKAVPFQTALVSLMAANVRRRRRCMERQETALFVPPPPSLLPAGQCHCTVYHLDGWMALLSASLPHQQNYNVHFHIYVFSKWYISLGWNVLSRLWQRYSFQIWSPIMWGNKRDWDCFETGQAQLGVGTHFGNVTSLQQRIHWKFGYCVFR